MKVKLSLLAIIFFSLTTFSQASTDCTLTTTLRQGNKGEQVQCLQEKLNITTDGKFGKNTKTSVITFQTSNNLKGDGIVGKLTREILNKKEIKLSCTQGELFNTNTGSSCIPNTLPTLPVSVVPRYFVHAASRYLDVTYIASSNGSISGVNPQRIIDGGNGTAVTATPDAGYVFDTWSDGVLTATRTDTNVNNDKIVTATFIPTIATAAIAGVTAPVTGATPTATISDTSEYTATISWNTSPVTFASATIYTATITITPKTGYTLTGVPANFFTVAGATATNAINTGVVSAVFPVTDTTINTAAIAGVTAPVIGAIPTSSIADTTEYTATISWSPTDNPFLIATVYTATITITPKTSYTLTGVSQDFFTVAGATATNTANTGVVTAVFPETVLSAGVNYQGGVIAYIFQSGDPGYVSGETHGLIAATADHGSLIRWNNGVDTTTNATGTAIGTGLVNTNTIITSQGAVTTSYAAGVARAYAGGGYTDWYLPSRDELDKLYLNRVAIGGFVGYFYWSSSEINNSTAWVKPFFNGVNGGGGKTSPYLVRAIRSF